MTVKEQLITKVEALRAVQKQCEELRRLRQVGIASSDELLDIEKYIAGMIQNYKNLVIDLNHQYNSQNNNSKKPVI